MRFNLNRPLHPGRIVPETRPHPVFRLLDQTAHHWIAMDIADHFGASLLSVDVAIVVAILPELLTWPSQLPRSDLLEGFEKLRQENPRRLVGEQVNVLEHQHVGVNSRLMPRARLFQHGFHGFPGSRRFQQRETMKTTEADEVQRFRLLEPFQAARHGPILTPYRPLIAKNAMNRAQLLIVSVRTFKVVGRATCHATEGILSRAV